MLPDHYDNLPLFITRNPNILTEQHHQMADASYIYVILHRDMSDKWFNDEKQQYSYYGNDNTKLDLYVRKYTLNIDYYANATTGTNRQLVEMAADIIGSSLHELSERIFRKNGCVGSGGNWPVPYCENPDLPSRQQDMAKRKATVDLMRECLTIISKWYMDIEDRVNSESTRQIKQVYML